MSNVQQKLDCFFERMDSIYDQESSFPIKNRHDNSFTIKLCDDFIFQQKTHSHSPQINISNFENNTVGQTTNQCTSMFLIKEGEVTLIYLPKTNAQSSTKQKLSLFTNQTQLTLPNIENNQFSYILLKTTAKFKRRQSCSKSTVFCSDYNKNLPGYIFKKAMRLLFNNSAKTRLKLIKTCRKWGVSLLKFIDYYLQLQTTILGPNSLIPFFYKELGDEQNMKMMEMFDYLLCKMLRGRYLLTALKEGKMKDLGAYIEIKNKYLLYFRSLFS